MAYRFRMLGLFCLAGSLSGALPSGLYVGRFSGLISGDLVVALDGTDMAYSVGYIESMNQIFFSISEVGPDGALSITTDFGAVNATISATELNGSFPGLSFSAERIRPEGPFAAQAGLYAGTLGGSKIGNVFAAILPDGQIWFLNQSIAGMDGGRGTLGTTGELHITSFAGTSLIGAVDSEGNALGTWSEPDASGEWMIRLAVPLSDFLSLLPFATEKVEDGWGWNNWLGWYKEVSFPWVYHLEHGWWWFSPKADANPWVYDLVLGWCYVQPDAYPWIYSSKEQDWLFYLETPGVERWFYSSSEDTWLELPQS